MVACYASLCAETDVALASFEHALETGYNDLEWASVDPDLRAIRDEPRFQEALRLARERIEKQQGEGS